MNHRGVVLSVAGMVVAVSGLAHAASPVSVGWTRKIGAGGDDFMRFLARDASGNFHLGGTVNAIPTALRYDSAGNFLWNSQFGTAGDVILGNAADAAGNSVVTGIANSSLFAPNAGLGDVFLRKYDVVGNVVWSRQFGTVRSDQGQSAAFDSTGNIYIAGRIGVGLSLTDAFVAKYDPAGNQLWLRQFGTAGNDSANGIAVDSSGNVLTCGFVQGDLAGAVGGQDIFLRKYDSAGNVIWTRQTGSTLPDGANNLALDGAGNVFIAGYGDGIVNGVTPGDHNDREAVVVKYDSDGNLGWVRQIDADTDDMGNDVDVDALGRVYLAGTSSSSLYNFLLSEFDSAGNPVFTQVIGPGGTDGGLFGIAADPAGGRLWAAGFTTGNFGGAGNGADGVLFEATLPEPTGAVVSWLALSALLIRRRAR